MTPLRPHGYDTVDTYYAADGETGPPLDRWIASREATTLARLRGPFVLAAQRLGLASRRCDDLAERIEELRTRLLNVPPHVAQGDVHAIEERLLGLEEKLHNERVAAWKDLAGLSAESRDAAIEAMRQSWLNEFARLGGDGL
jgi:hypothetical protein